MARKTSWMGLEYECYGPRHWQVVDAETGSQIGPIYATKAELLACLPAYAAEYGAERSRTNA